MAFLPPQSRGRCWFPSTLVRPAVAVGAVLIALVFLVTPGRGIPNDPTKNPVRTNCPVQPFKLVVTFRVVGLPLVRPILALCKKALPPSLYRRLEAVAR